MRTETTDTAATFVIQTERLRLRHLAESWMDPTRGSRLFIFECQRASVIR